MGTKSDVNMSSVHTSVFKSNKIQAVRLPKVMALSESITKVDIVAIGNTRIVSAAGESWAQWFDSVGMSDDFMQHREQPDD